MAKTGTSLTIGATMGAMAGDDLLPSGAAGSTDPAGRRQAAIRPWWLIPLRPRSSCPWTRTPRRIRRSTGWGVQGVEGIHARLTQPTETGRSDPEVPEDQGVEQEVIVSEDEAAHNGDSLNTRDLNDGAQVLLNWED